LCVHSFALSRYEQQTRLIVT
jgi:hypothetical protein